MDARLANGLRHNKKIVLLRFHVGASRPGVRTRVARNLSSPAFLTTLATTQATLLATLGSSEIDQKTVNVIGRNGLEIFELSS